MKFLRVFLLGLLFISFQASAVLYKNPVSDLAAGKKTIGAALVLMSRDVEGLGGSAEADQTLIAGTMTMGLDNVSALEFRVGLDDADIDGLGPGSDGILLGAIYRYTFQKNANGLSLGFFGSFQTSFLDNNSADTDVTVIDFGVGASTSLGDGLNAYGGGAFSVLDGSIDTGFGSADFDEDDTIGFFGGIEKKLQGNMKVGLELNIIHQTGFAVFFESTF